MILRSENIDLLILINIFYQKIQEMLNRLYKDFIYFLNVVGYEFFLRLAITPKNSKNI